MRLMILWDIDHTLIDSVGISLVLPASGIVATAACVVTYQLS
jgi:hypothetical protein